MSRAGVRADLRIRCVARDRVRDCRLGGWQTGSGAAAAGGRDWGRFLLATSVPDYWIPFQPQRIDPQKPDIRLQRAKALIDQYGASGFSRPLGRLLEPERRDLSLFEEEVPRSGLKLTRRFEYTRWADGSTFLWLSRRKGVGAGEGSSGLRFDRIEEV